MPDRARRMCVIWGTVVVLGALSCTKAPITYTVDVLVPGSHFHGIHGLTFDADDRLYAGSVVGQTTYRIDPNSGEVEEFLAPPQGMADDLEFAPDGRLVWTSFLLGIIHAQRSGGPVEVLASGLPGINSLAFKEDGRLFATQVFLGDALYEIDLKEGKEPRKILEGMGGLNGFDFGPDGRLYGPLWFKGEVARVDVDRGEITTLATGFKIPAAANFDSKGVDPDTGHQEVVAEDLPIGLPAPQGIPASFVPTGVSVSASGTLYLTSDVENAIYRIRPQ